MHIDIARLTVRLPRVLRRHKLVQALLWVFPDSRIQRVQFNGSASVHADVSDPFIRQCLLSGSFEPEFFAVAAALLPPDGVFFDVGANFGMCSYGLLASGRRDLRCYLFEANERLCGLLERSRQLYDARSVRIVHTAVSDAPGAVGLVVPSGNVGGAYVSDSSSPTVRTTLLDEFISGEDIPVVHLLKLDVEGSELRALRGLRKTMTAGVCRAIYFELSAVNLRRFDAAPESVLTLLRESGYSVYAFKHRDRSPGAGGSRTLLAGDTALTLWPVERTSADIHTDLLALHDSCAWRLS